MEGRAEHRAIEEDCLRAGAAQLERGSTKLTAQDANYGLIQKIVESIPKRRILTLRPIYSRIALSDLARKVGLPDAPGQAAVKDVIEKMVAAGEIQASVAGSPEVVTFEDDDDYDSPAAMERLRDAQTVANSLLAELRRADEQHSLNPKWLQKVSSLCSD